MEKSRKRYLPSLVGFVVTFLSTMAVEAGDMVVTSAGDAGGTCPGATCTLRQAIATATPGGTISFAAGLATIELTSDELLIDKFLTINGPGANLLTVERSAEMGTPLFHIFHVEADMFVTISGLTIRNGNASSGDNGGAVFNDGTLTIDACSITGNLASDSGGLGGGAIFNNGGDPGGTLIISNSTISNNSTLSSNPGGGGITDGGGTVIITNSTISGNSAGNGSGGGLYSLGAVTITNTTISDNSAVNGSGGGIYTFGHVTITNSTVSHNSAAQGGGIQARPSGTFFKPGSTIIAENTAPVGPDLEGAVSSQGYNLIGDPTGATISGDTIGNQLNVDPLLGPLQDNGGPTKTRALLPGSPAIDKSHSRGSVTDQRGFTRPVGTANVEGGDGSDIGAFEVQTSATPGPTSTPGATPTPTPVLSPTPTPGVTPTPNPTPTPAASATPGATPTTLGNISTRLRVETGENALIGGFIVTGTQPKRIIVRAIGPSLPVAGALADPILELRDSAGVLIRSNDNWRSDQEAEISATGIPPSNDLESAIVAILPANNSAYTAIVRGVNDGTGVGLIEAYDLDRTVNSKLANISTRGLVQTGENVLIAGTIVLGQAPQRVLVRAIGPSLPVAGKLEDPTLELRNGDGTLIRSNDNWRSDQEAEIAATGIPPSNDLESALIETLPGNGAAYTAIVRGVDNGTGVGLVEVYALN